MGYISSGDWIRYVERLAALNKRAADEMRRYIQRVGFGDINALIDFAYALATKYGEGAAALAAEMYDASAALEGVILEPAIPAATATVKEVSETVQGIVEQSSNEELLSSAVGRLVKLAGADTTLQNAVRDQAEFAWVPNGDTCAFCLTLASAGWRQAGKKTLNNGHATHIHSNCDCAYAVRHTEALNVRGYEPEKYYELYADAPGKTAKDRINAMRREFYAENKSEINAQKRSAYAKRRERNASAAEEINVDNLDV